MIRQGQKQVFETSSIMKTMNNNLPMIYKTFLLETIAVSQILLKAEQNAISGVPRSNTKEKVKRISRLENVNFRCLGYYYESITCDLLTTYKQKCHEKLCKFFQTEKV